jgi:hypothetical protein
MTPIIHINVLRHKCDLDCDDEPAHDRAPGYLHGVLPVSRTRLRVDERWEPALANDEKH